MRLAITRHLPLAIASLALPGTAPPASADAGPGSHARFALLLRDIPDAPDATIPCLQASSFERDVDRFAMVAVLGTPDVFDMRREYGLADRSSAQIEYCGYLRSQAPARDPRAVRAELGIGGDERLMLVTPGGGEDGHTCSTRRWPSARCSPPWAWPRRTSAAWRWTRCGAVRT